MKNIIKHITTIRKNWHYSFSKAVVLIAFFVNALPLLILRENYIFTEHDYLDSWPSLFQVLRSAGLFFAIDAPMPIMKGVSTSYLYFDFGIYRVLNYFFGFIWGEIINKTAGILIGYYSIKKLLQSMLKGDDESYITELLAAAYAISPVYPNWTISFAILPLYILFGYELIKKSSIPPVKLISLSLAFAFLMYFPCVGIYVLGCFACIFCAQMGYTHRVNKNFALAIILMIVSVLIFNVNIVTYVLKGEKLNRELFKHPVLTDFNQFLGICKDIYRLGQYHAAPILDILIPLCMICFLLVLYTCIRTGDFQPIYLAFGMQCIIILLCGVYALDYFGYVGKVFAKILPLLRGFNFGRIVYANNILWYIFTAYLISKIPQWKWKKGCLLLILCINIMAIMFSTGYYRDLRRNLLYQRSIDKGAVTYKQYFDTDYFESLKEKINYTDEPIISIGYHPAVAMFNGFNTLDGYLCINPLAYHNEFRTIIAPTLDKYVSLEKYYDEWGGRLYCYIDDSKNVRSYIPLETESKELLIDVAAFSGLGGKYILSKWRLENSDMLGLRLKYHEAINSKLYDVWVYEIP